jgi:hypothetical protein
MVVEEEDLALLQRAGKSLLINRLDGVFLHLSRFGTSLELTSCGFMAFEYTI